jgi:serine/threonine-protein kinase
MAHDALTVTLPELELVLADSGDQQLVRGRVACPGILLVGRMPTAQVVLPASDKQAERLHFHIELSQVYCRLTSHAKHGTFVNGLLISGQGDLRHGDLVRAGESVFLVSLLRRGVPAELPASPTVLWQPDEVAATASEVVSPTPESHPAGAQPLAPVQLPGYRILRQLGTGGMGMVWLAEDRNGQPAACKLIRPELALNPETCARFRRETNHLRDLNHRYIVGFRDAGEFRGMLYLVMDYVDGCNLAEMLKREGPFDPGRAVRLACQLLEALLVAHNNGVVHRDVKPSNVLLQTGPHGEEIRLADFGMAKAYQATDAQTVTLPGLAGGTLAFAAPEMVTDFRRAGPLADQYGAAATLYNLLTRRGLHDCENVLDLLDHVRARDPVPLERRRAGLPAGLAGIVHRALDRDPRQRFPTCRHLRDELLPYADGDR